MGSWKRKRAEAMGEEALNDVHLVGTDGEEVHCSKTFLATVSPVFMKMFFGSFKEKNIDRCTLEFRSVIIRLIVKYCYCGELDLDVIFDKSRSLEEEACLLIEVREAGRFFELEDVFSDAESKIGGLVFCQNDNKKYQYASALLTELFKRGEDENTLGVTIYQFVVEYTMECFGPTAPENGSTGAYYHSHPSILSKVLQETENTYAIVRCIQTWYSFESNRTANGYSDEEKRALLEVAENIDLKRLSTKQLSNVKQCSLFSSERILEAFIHHCQASEIEIEAPRTKLWLHIAGEELEEDINGFYKHRRRVVEDGVILNIFIKKVERDGISCRYIVHRKQTENKWFISSTKTANGAIPFKRASVEVMELEVRETSIQKHIYESSYQSLPAEDPAIPPFNTWKRVEGTGPVPIVASFYRDR